MTLKTLSPLGRGTIVRSLAFITAIFLSGCASKPPATSSVDRFIDKQTAFVVDELQYVSNYPGALASYDTDPIRIVRGDDPNLYVVVDAIWTGTVEDLAKHVGRHLGYDVMSQGEKLGSPLIVSVTSYTLPAIGLLRQGFSQARGRAKLEIDAVNRVMTIIYRRPERSPIPHQDDTQP